MLEASIIISFYNNVSALKCILSSIKQHADKIEVVIADDGSNPDSIEKVNLLVHSSPLSIKLVSQKDIGFRKNRILNKAISFTTTDYLIFIDGDCIPQRFFIEDHLAHKEKGYVLNGRRADIAGSMKDALISAKDPTVFFNDHKFSIISLSLLGKGKNIEKGFRIEHPWLSGFLNRKPKGLLGCNFSLYKDDLLAINGFDNRYEVPGIGEDSDIEYRLVANGTKVRNLFYKAILLHVMHPELTRHDTALNIFNETKKAQQIIALDGYNQAFDKL